MGTSQEILKQLIAACRDSEKTFGKAAREVVNENLRMRLSAMGRQRSEFAQELDRLLNSGASARISPGSSRMREEHGWRESEILGHPRDDASLLAQCEAVDENTLSQYEEALIEDLPPAIRPVVERQRGAVQEALLEQRGFERVRRAG